MDVAAILGRFPALSVLVVGDLCLDRWCSYDASLSEPSRETGIPRIAVVRTENTPGAAGTVANNLAALGIGRVSVLSAIGDDGEGFDLIRALSERRIETDLLVRSPKIRTFTYTKLMDYATGVEDLPRVDLINTKALPGDVEEAIVARLLDFGPSFDVIVVSDQAETEQGGVVTPAVRKALEQLSNGRMIWVDSRRRIEQFRGLALKPNEDEANAACERIGAPHDYAALRRHTQARCLMVTCGEHGVVVVDERGERLVPARPATPVDICGAGDSFSAGAAATLAVTGDAFQAAKFGNLVASITVTQKGTGAAAVEQVLAAR